MTASTPNDQTFTSPKKKRRIFPWFFLAVQAVFLAWIIGGSVNASGGCTGETGSALEACQAGTAIGTGIGVALIVGLWVAVDFILAITWLIVRKR